MEYTAVLQDWYRDSYHSIIWAYIYEDKKNRFRDGTWIHTSLIDSKLLENAKEGDIIQTLNSSYLLGNKKREMFVE